MGDAFQCDRCGEFEEGEPVDEIPVQRRRRKKEVTRKYDLRSTRRSETWNEFVVGEMDVDLCSDCAERLANFLNGNLGFPDP